MSEPGENTHHDVLEVEQAPAHAPTASDEPHNDSLSSSGGAPTRRKPRATGMPRKHEAPWWEKTNAIAQIIVAIIACLGIYLTLRFEKLTHYHIELEEAAQVYLEHGSLSDLGTGIPQFNLSFRNVGKTPATNGTITVRIGLIGPSGDVARERSAVEMKIKELDHHGGALVHLTSLNSGESRNSPLRITDLPLNENEIHQVLDRNARVVIVGILAYEDIFGKSHQHHFCMNYEAGPDELEQAQRKLVNSIQALPTEDPAQKSAKSALLSLVQSIPVQPHQMTYCLGGND